MTSRLVGATRKGAPSLALGEHLERPELERVADRLLQDLGLAEHQALIAEHADGAQPHIHLMVNRIHADTGRASGIRREAKRRGRAALGASVPWRHITAVGGPPRSAKITD